MKTTELSNIWAEATLTELIDNNNQVLETKIKSSTLENFIELLLYDCLHEKYVQLIRAVITSNGEPIAQNQIEMSNLIFDKIEV